jgi:hypothetical protein
MERFWFPQHNEWFIRLLLRFPTPLSVTALSLDAFAHIIDPLIGRRVHKQAKIQEIYDLACHSIALPIREDSPAVATFRMQLERYLQLCKTRDALEEQADISATWPRLQMTSI